MSRGRKKYSPAFKAKVALEAAKGQETVTQLAARYEVHPGHVNGAENGLLKKSREVIAREIGGAGAIESRETTSPHSPIDNARPV